MSEVSPCSDKTASWILRNVRSAPMFGQSSDWNCVKCPKWSQVRTKQRAGTQEMFEVTPCSAKTTTVTAENVRSDPRFDQSSDWNCMKCAKWPQVRPKQRLELHEMCEVAPGSTKTVNGTA
jgi:hypothetical protein